MAQKTLIGGTSYEITGGKTLIGGTGYDINSGKTLIGGTGYDVSLAKYKWEKYNATATTTYTQVKSGTVSSVSPNGQAVCIGSQGISTAGYTFDSSTGKYTIASYSTVEYDANTDHGVVGSYNNCLMIGSNSGSTLYYAGSTDDNMNFSWTYFTSGIVRVKGRSSDDGKYYYNSMIKYTSSGTTQYSQGSTSYGFVTSNDEGAYPENGEQDGYWYVRVT